MNVLAHDHNTWILFHAIEHDPGNRIDEFDFGDFTLKIFTILVVRPLQFGKVAADPDIDKSRIWPLGRLNATLIGVATLDGLQKHGGDLDHECFGWLNE